MPPIKPIRAKLFASLMSAFSGAPRELSFTVIDDFDAAIGTTLGLKRENNEDRACFARVCLPLPSKRNVYLSVLCDGLGGMQSGEACAAWAISATVAGTIDRLSRRMRPDDALTLSVLDANDQIYARYRGNGGTTLSAVLLCDDENVVAVNVGDSRIYGINPNEKISQLSADDNIAEAVQKLHPVSSSHLEDLEFGEHLTQFVGIGSSIRIKALDLSSRKSDEYFLLASDGAWRMSNGVFQKTIVNAKKPIDIIRRVISVSDWCGGVDNTTVVVFPNYNTLRKLEKESSSISTDQIDLWSPFGKLSVINEASSDSDFEYENGPQVADIKYSRVPNSRRGMASRGKKEKKSSSIKSGAAKTGNPKQLDIQIVVDGYGNSKNKAKPSK